MKPEVAVDLRRQRLAKKAGAETRRRLVVVAAGHDVLDVAAGNGNVAIAAARRGRGCV
jgi:ubiquinone/menaquinone biosynthesis C-methylase UbiE